MNQFTAQQKIELLERKYLFLMNLPVKAFPFELVNFVSFINQEEFIKDFTLKIREDFYQKRGHYKNFLNCAISKIGKLRGKYNLTWKDIGGWLDKDKNTINEKIDNYLNPDLAWSEMDINANRLENKSRHWRNWEEISLTLNNLLRKLSDMPQFTTRDFNQIEDLIEREKFEFRTWEIILETSSGRALEYLEKVVEKTYKVPKYSNNFKTFQEKRVYRLIEESDLQELQVIYKDFVYQPNIRSIESVKEKITVVYEALRQEIGSTRLRTTILSKYAVRCENYNRNYITELSKKDSSKLEETLTRDLALYLFDNGITVWYRVKTEKKETDLIEINPASPNPMLIEVKAYHENSGKHRKEVIKDFWQTISYLENHMKSNPSYEGYLVFYRLGGNLFILPEKFTHQSFTIYPILIDLADNVGRSQENGITVSIEDILKETPAKI